MRMKSKRSPSYVHSLKTSMALLFQHVKRRFQSSTLAYSFFLLLGILMGFLVCVNLPIFVSEVKDTMYALGGNVQDVINRCKAVGLEGVQGTKDASVVQGEGQSWNHVAQSSGSACSYFLSRKEQLPNTDVHDLPRIFMYEPAVNAYAKPNLHCEEQFFAGMIRANITGTLVDRIEDADRIYVSFYAQCFPNQEMNTDALVKRGGVSRKLLDRAPFELLWEELREHRDLKHRLRDVFIFSERHWTKRTGFGMPIRHLLKDYPFTVLSPEVTNLQAREMTKRNLPWLSRHVVIPQPPLVAWPLRDAKEIENRPHKFCFSGTQINRERRVLSAVLSQRNDSYVVAGCRLDRKKMQHHLRNNKFSASQQYRACQMCIIPLGDSLSDRRLFDAMASGCVPVVTQKMRPLPFSGISPDMDYRKAIIKLHPSGTQKDLKRQLETFESLSARDMASYREASVSIAEKLSYSECGGHSGLVLTLAQLKVQRDLEERGKLPRDLSSLLYEKIK